MLEDLLPPTPVPIATGLGTRVIIFVVTLWIGTMMVLVGVTARDVWAAATGRPIEEPAEGMCFEAPSRWRKVQIDVAALGSGGLVAALACMFLGVWP